MAKRATTRERMIALADKLAHDARVLQEAAAILDGADADAARVALPGKLRAAARLGKLRAAAAAPSNGHAPEPAPTLPPLVRMLAAIRDGHATSAAIREHGGVIPGSRITHAMHKGFVTRREHEGVLHYTITPRGLARINGTPTRAIANGTPIAARGAHRNDPPTALRKVAFTAFLLRRLHEHPRTLPDFVPLLRAVGHPIQTTMGVAGPMARLSANGFVKRRADGLYTLTAKGDRRRDELADLPDPTPGAIVE